MTPRAIDAMPARTADSLQIEVLALGLSRTGTLSMKTALNKLGYNSYHCEEVGQRHLRSTTGENQYAAWLEAFRAKIYGNGKVYGRDEFGKILRNYSAVTDAPCVCFAEELVSAFPPAKVILTSRDADKWIFPIERSFYMILESDSFRPWRVVAIYEKNVIGPLEQLLLTILQSWTHGDWQNRAKLRHTLSQHAVHVRALVAPHNLLEWAPGDGWEPLCRFLEKAVPDEPFPHVNQGDDIAWAVWMAGVFAVGRYVRAHVVGPLLMAVGIGLVAFLARR